MADRVATAHGFRSSFRGWASEHGYACDLAERVLAHPVTNATEAAYHRTDQREGCKRMMQSWGSYVMSKVVIVAAKSPAFSMITDRS
jgi:integrase